HIQGDWILIYKISQNELTLTLSRSGSHSKILGM
ncbi:MAG: type II toxin-antitoxin system mRNA interferase toxin, RelE/StbE family, partial [Synergistaceae bacterium]|nr:type II toxin-antitoxin system mRNA interferase toxin, RelE/StbE family [Synergistaceae bacterium]